jgi:prepilin-type N-terminal cleavage/methylation domain-containing protein
MQIKTNIRRIPPRAKGFTIVELLIVIVVIGILAAITIVAYNGLQSRARTAAVQADLSNVAKKMSIDQVNNGSFALTATAVDENRGLPASQGTAYQYTSDGSSFCITATNGTTSYKISNANPSPTAGGCPGHSANGVPAITNVVRNPTAANNATDWVATASAGGSPTGARITGQTTPLTGVTTAYRGTLTGTPSSWWRVQNSQPYPVTAGQSYTLSSYVRSSITGSTGVIIIWMSSTGTTVTENASTGISQTANTWARRSVTATAPAGTATARLQAYAPTGLGVANATIDATGMMFVESSSLANYADGDSTDWIWNGTPHASTSTGPPQ